MRRTIITTAAALLLSNTALAAGDVYFNGVKVDPRSLKGQNFTAIDLSVDANGDIRIDAPRYKIEVQGTAAAGEAVAAGRYWLVAQDDSSQGHTIDVVVNDRIVKTITSGGGPVVVDLGQYLKKGANDVRIKAQPGPVPSGGDMTIYIGQGSNDSGTVVLKRPDIAYSRGASDPPTGGSRTYTLTAE